jgi:hypothetical protein
VTNTAWRVALVTLCILALAQNFAGWWTAYNVVARTGVQVDGAASTLQWRIDVAPESPAYAAGLRSGDVVDAAHLSSAERYRLWTGTWVYGERVTLPVLRPGGAEAVTVTASQKENLRWDSLMGWIGSTWAFAFALLLAWRRSGTPQARLLTMLLVLPNVAINLFPFDWATGSALVDAASFAFSNVCGAGWALLATFSMLYARPPDALRRTLALATYVCAAVSAMLGISAVAAAWLGFADPLRLFGGRPVANAAIALVLFFAFSCALATFARTRGAQREQFGWVIAALSPWVVGGMAVSVASALDLRTALVVSLAVANVGNLAAPVGFTYAMLNRRLLDISFALNRAAVYGTVSLAVVGIFVLVEWAFGEWFSHASHTTNFAVGAALALALGVSARTVHRRVDDALDNLFFRKRHEDEQAIRNFAREAPYTTDSDTLVSRAQACLQQHAGATTVAILVLGEAGRYGGVSENDRAIVSMRTWNKPVDLHGLQTQLEGDFAYPMIARGRLIGVIAIGPKQSGESYAPDESAAIAQLANGVGTALDLISNEGDRTQRELLDAVRALQVSIGDLSTRLRQ